MVFLGYLDSENRICQICNLNAVENEFHFIMKCSAYNDIRFTLFKQIDETLVTQNFIFWELWVLVNLILSKKLLIMLVQHSTFVQT